MTILESILQLTATDLTLRQESDPLHLWIEQAEQSAKTRLPHRFMDALKSESIAVIAELKKASPSKGLICAEFEPLQIAREYTAGGAAALSVLTEPHFFQGHLDILRNLANVVTLPLLRKDFIIAEYQIYEAALAGASAVLLIVAALEDRVLRQLLSCAHHLGLDALVEVHDETELQRAISAGARMIGVNNRNLKTFQVDLNISLRLIEQMPSAVIAVCESGIHTHQHLQQMQRAGFKAVLVGEALMTRSDRTAALRALRGI
jgi:indole-3-glycerol phosphate synthase